MSATVINKNGYELDFEAAKMLMDDGIKTFLTSLFYWDSDQDFFTEYETLHEKMFGAEWELSKSNPVW